MGGTFFWADSHRGVKSGGGLAGLFWRGDVLILISLGLLKTSAPGQFAGAFLDVRAPVLRPCGRRSHWRVQASTEPSESWLTECHTSLYEPPLNRFPPVF